MLETVQELDEKFNQLFSILEWIFTIIFTAEYIVRIYIVERKRKYIFSFLGLIDLLSILPAYLSIFLVGSHYLSVLRIMRLLRVFRVLKLTRFIGEAAVLQNALKNSRYKISVFLIFVLSIVVIMGTLLYMVEGAEHGFTSIPRSIYWAIVTLTTVGYGDISPGTATGQFIASVIMILGYGIIAVPTGIVSTEMVQAQRSSSKKTHTITCAACGETEHLTGAGFCQNCGEPLDSPGN